MHALAQHVAQLADHHILVIGDMTLDEYLYGRATRLSREAPVPVLELTRREAILGGAANPARNIVALGSHAIQIGVIGADPEGSQIVELLTAATISTSGVIIATDRPTTRKTRIVADEAPRLPQQVARLDRLDRSPLPTTIEDQIIAALHIHIPRVAAVLCSDYQLGLLSPRVIATVRDLCAQHSVIFSVDAQGNAHLYQGADLFRCNNTEAEAALGQRLSSDAEYRSGLKRLRQELHARLVIVTRGPEGVSLIDTNDSYRHLPAVQVSEVYDTIGAGDTFIAVATLALAAGLSGPIAATLANTAAALVVRRLGNAVVSPAELRAALVAQ
jgi:rfaE bifunctional protein kinase chain/domain